MISGGGRTECTSCGRGLAGTASDPIVALCGPEGTPRIYCMRCAGTIALILDMPGVHRAQLYLDKVAAVRRTRVVEGWLVPMRLGI